MSEIPDTWQIVGAAQCEPVDIVSSLSERKRNVCMASGLVEACDPTDAADLHSGSANGQEQPLDEFWRPAVRGEVQFPGPV
ncbi:hypothetical protein GCM10007388_25270 [Pseudoduganella plicata]|uniref:Uncharacterized protein n=1 Tax=Pseudoduganella plicata TaxID=321984 RepID=A0AA87Y3C9_9BURK|nr:hypothetical protein GCM10007388_25270 [Pseudoduganella plicata]